MIDPIANGSLFTVPGLKGAALATGVKPSGLPDLAVVTSDEPMSTAAVFTTNQAPAAPVVLSRSVLRQHQEIRGFVVNSGNANALTGTVGDEHARCMLGALDEITGGPSLVFSTGIIGVPLPIEPVLGGIPQCGKLLDSSGAGVADAILTTDSTRKECAASVTLSDGTQFHVGGIAKGSGMIHPNMATMLAFMATDAPIDSRTLDGLLTGVVDRSFNAISVDGETSTNDAVLLMANDPARVDRSLDIDDLRRIEAALDFVAKDLAEQIVNDGEGASRIMEIRIEEAKTREDAKSIANAIARSSLVKTALAGGDPNWGRILAAAGTAGVSLALDHVSLRLGDYLVFSNGSVVPFPRDEVSSAFSAKRVIVQLTLGAGSHAHRMLTTDLTKRYVEINSEYTT